MPVTKIHVNGKSLVCLESGSATVFAGASSIELGVSDLEFEIQFQTDAAINRATVAPVGAVGKKLTLAFVNFHNGLPTTFQSEVGTYNGQKLWIVVSLSATGEIPTENRLITYAFYVGETA